MYVFPFHQKDTEYVPLARLLSNATAFDLPGGRSRGRKADDGACDHGDVSRGKTAAFLWRREYTNNKDPRQRVA